MADIRIQIGDLSARDVVAVAFRRRWAILVCYSVIVLGAASYGFFWPPSYEATVRYLVKNDHLEPLLTADQEGVRTVSRPAVTEADLNSEAEIMRSEAVLEKTVRDLRLDGAQDPWPLRLLRWPVGLVRDVYNAYHDRPGESAVEHAVRRLTAALDVEPQRQSSVILVRLRWGHPRAAEEILSEHSKRYLAQHLTVRRVADAKPFFAAQLERGRVELARIDGEINAIRPGATSDELEADRALASQQAAQLEADWRKARAAQDESHAREISLTEQLRPLPDRVVVQDRTVVSAQVLEALKLRVMDLRLQHTELLQKYDPTNQLVVQAQQRLAEAERMLTQEQARPYSEETTGRNQTADALDQDLKTTRVQGHALAARERATITQQQAVLAKVAELEQQATRLRNLEHERAAVQHSVDEYARQLEEARVNDAMEFVNVAIIEPVSAGASPVSPNLSLLMGLAIGLGLIVSVALAFALDLADHRIRTGRDLEMATGVAVLAVLDRYPPKGEGSVLA